MSEYLCKIELKKDWHEVAAGDTDALDWLTPEELAYHVLRGNVVLVGEPKAPPVAPSDDKPLTAVNDKPVVTPPKKRLDA